MATDLFDPIVDLSNLHKLYNIVRTGIGSEPGRILINEIFEEYNDLDGNFIEQFQTSGFNQRIFELFLYSYFSQSGYNLEKNQNRPDFIVTYNGITVAIEATTANPTQNGMATINREEWLNLTTEEIKKKQDDEIPIKLGSPLFSKLNKKYWLQENCKNIPLVIAIEAFYEEGALHYSDFSLSQYLYGLRAYPSWTEDGQLVVNHEEIKRHEHNGKIIPSNFFGQPDAENISAVLFCNTGTFPKFNRVGYLRGLHRGNLEMIRVGDCYDPDPNSAKPKPFVFDLDNPILDETWGEGLVVLHNPNARIPLKKHFFKDACDTYLEDGQIETDTPNFHPFSSITSVFEYKDLPTNIFIDNVRIDLIMKIEFDSYKPIRHPVISKIYFEKEWYANETRSVLGVVVQDSIDKDWRSVVLSRDNEGFFRGKDFSESCSSREEARDFLIQAIIQSYKTMQAN